MTLPDKERVRELIRDWGPYALLWSAIALGLYWPTLAIIILAALSFAALDELRKPKVSINDYHLILQAAELERNVKKYHKFSGLVADVTISQKYMICGQKYEVVITRADDEVEVDA